MARTIRLDWEGAAHHAYGRGNRRQPIFNDDQDCRTFLKKVLEYQADHGIVILAYCLMINHYHFVLRSAKGEVSLFMKRLLGSYTRSGHNGILSGRGPLVDVDAVLGLFGGVEAYRAWMSQPNRYQRRSLAEIAQDLFGPNFMTRLDGPKSDVDAVSARRQFAAAGVLEGHRPSALAKFLGKTPASITYLLRQGAAT